MNKIKRWFKIIITIIMSLAVIYNRNQRTAGLRRLSTLRLFLFTEETLIGGLGNNREGLSGVSCLTLALNSRIALCLCGLRTRKSGRCNRYLRYALSARANKLFQKRTVFVFTESWSRDQLMQKAYLFYVFVFTEIWSRDQRMQKAYLFQPGI